MSVFNVAATADDVCAYWTFDSSNGLTTTGDIYAASFEVIGIWAVYEMALRFLNVTIPKGSTIDSAYFTIKAHDPVGTPDMDIQAFDEDNSAQVANFADFQGRSRTTANVNWTQALSADTVYNSPEIKTVIQEIIDRASWASGNALQLVISDHDTKYPNAPPAGTNQQGRFYEDADYGITLTIAYTSYTDIGVRIRTSTVTIKIGVEALTASHKLRIRKGDTTYGIPLLATNDPNASGLRIYDGANVKALPKVA